MLDRKDRQKALDASINKNGEEMRRLLLSARDRVQLQIINAVKKGNPASAAWIRDSLYRNLQKEYVKLQGDLNGWTRDSVSSVAQEWTKYAVEDIPGGNYDKAWAMYSKKYLDDTVAQFSPSTMAGRAAVNAGTLDPAVGGMLKQDIDSLRRIVQETTRIQAATGMTAQEWRRTVQDQVLSENGAWKFIDAGGKTWSANNYFNMLNRTIAATTARETYLTQMAESDHDLATIEGGIPPNCCPDCLRWAGKIVSVSGTSKDYPSYKQAKEDGVFHPRCRHYLAVVLEGEEEEAKAEEERVRKWAADNGFPLTQKKVAPGDVKQTEKAKEKPLIEQKAEPRKPAIADSTKTLMLYGERFGTDKKQNIELALQAIKEIGIEARTVGTDLPEFVRAGIKSKGSAFYWRNPDTGKPEIVINQFNKAWDDPKKRERDHGPNGTGFFSSDNPARTLIHETGHFRYGATANAEHFFDNDKPFRDRVEKEVGKYASISVGEFIAEVYTGTETGREFPKDIMERYNQFKEERNAVTLPSHLQKLFKGFK